MKVTIKGYDGDNENDVTLSVSAVDGVIVGVLDAGDGEAGAWLTAEQLRDVAREALLLASRVDAANAALTTTEGGAR